MVNQYRMSVATVWVALCTVAGCTKNQPIEMQPAPVASKSSAPSIKGRDLAVVGTWREKIADAKNPKQINAYLTIRLKPDGTGSWSDDGGKKSDPSPSPITWFAHGDTVAFSFIKATRIGAAITSSQTLYAKLSPDKNSITYFVNDKPEGTASRMVDK